MTDHVITEVPHMELEQPPPHLALADRLSAMSPEKRRAIERLLRERKNRKASSANLTRRSLSKAPLSYAQQRLWLLDKIQPDSPLYTESFTKRFRFPLKTAALQRALNEIVRRHESLRTTFREEQGVPAQIIAQAWDIPFPVIDLRSLPRLQRESEALAQARREAIRPFDLSRGPLLRTTLYQLDGDDFLLSVSMHHIVCDAWSFALLIYELDTLYQANAHGLRSPLPELPIQYTDYAIWQRSQFEEDLHEHQLFYWKQQLKEIPALDLHTDFPRPRNRTYRGASLELRMSDSCLAALTEMSRREGATLFMTLLAAFAAVLHRYTGQDDFAIGVPVANRDRKELEGIIGFFVNMLVIRVDCSGNPPFVQFLARVREVAVAAYASQHFPFETLVEELQPQRDPSRNPLFQVTCQYLKETPSAHSTFEQPLNLEMGTAKFDLRLDYHESSAGLMIYLEYCSELFAGSTAQRMIRHLEKVLEGIVSNPSSRLSDLPLLTDAEQHQLLYTWNNTGSPYPSELCAHIPFETHARQKPDDVAVSDGPRRVTYGQLDHRSNQLACYLRSHDVLPDLPVAVCLERSIEMIVAELAVLKAGGAYLPLDPDYPSRRLELLLSTAPPRIIITRERYLDRFKMSNVPCWCVDRDSGALAHQESTPLETAVLAHNLAYIIFTSGSTGTPRAVAVEHRSLVNLITWHIRTYQVTGADRSTLVASPAFDASVWEIWPYLSAGACIHIPDHRTVADPELLLMWLAREDITLTFLPTPLAEIVLDLDISKALRLRALLTGGDKLRRGPRKSTHFQVMNHYGPTENTVVCTFAPVETDNGQGAPPIGRPIDNVRLYVTDRHGHLVAQGVPGELCIAGDGLARGYYNQPELTAEKFTLGDRHPHIRTRLYHTGDQVRYRDDGNLEFLGRLDDQVKIRGRRIEPGEIEAALNALPYVGESCVIACEDTREDKRLVAYVTLKDVPHTPSTGGTDIEQNVRIDFWRRLYEEIYNQPCPGIDPTFNLIGWNNSYTGVPFSESEMEEQVDQTVTRVRRLNPKRVLEIGCGTGLVLFKLAPFCEHYTGTDFSPAALEYVRQNATKIGLSNLTLLERTADDLEEIAPGSCDTIVLNSTVQYFPSADYLLRVLKDSVRILGSSGHLFVGDIRSHRLLLLFHLGVELRRAKSTVLARDLYEQVQQRVRQEHELVLGPEFFLALAQTMPEVTCVDVMLKRGRHHNELTRFRYDAIMRVGGERPRISVDEVLEWDANVNLENVRAKLKAAREMTLAIAGVPNLRLSWDARALSLIQEGAAQTTVGQLRERLDLTQLGVDPDEFWALEDELPCVVHLSWPTSGTHDRFDVLIQPRDKCGLVPWLGSTGQASCHDEHANSPVLNPSGHRFVAALRDALSERLPEYMIPSEFVVVESIPRTANGKIDRRGLPTPCRARLRPDVASVMPRTDLERRIAVIWQEVLGLERVGVHQNFFDVGGHSLLLVQVHGRLREELQIKHSVIDLFRYPTISSLARSVSQATFHGECDADLSETRETLA